MNNLSKKEIQKDKEQDILIDSIIKNSKNPTAESVTKNLKLIEDLLKIQESRSLLIVTRTKTGRKRNESNYRQVLMARIEAEN